MLIWPADVYEIFVDTDGVLSYLVDDVFPFKPMGCDDDEECKLVVRADNANRRITYYKTNNRLFCSKTKPIGDVVVVLDDCNGQIFDANEWIEKVVLDGSFLA